METAEKTRVVMLFHKSFQPYQGHYLRTYNQARSLVRDGCDVTILAWDRECRYEADETRDGIRIRRFGIRAGDFQGPKNILNVLKYNLAVFRDLRRRDFDMVTCYSLDAMTAGWLAARLRRRKAILDLCEPEYYAFWDRRFAWLLAMIRRLERFMARRYDHVFVHNEYQVRKFQSAGIRHVTQVGSYPNRSMMPAEPRVRDGREIVIGRFGTLYENNGIEEFVEAFKRLLDKQKGRPDGVTYTFLLAGRVMDAYRSTLEALLAPLGDRVVLSGPFTPPDLPALYAKIDISCILYRSSADWFRNITPTKLFESLACGVPVLATDMGEVRRIVERGPCGMVVDENDPDGICAAIETMAADPDLRRRMSGNGLRLAREEYTWEAHETVFREVYRALAASR